MPPATIRLIRIPIWIATALFVWGAVALAADFADDTPVYYGGGKRGHIDGCPRLSPEAKAAGPNTTYGAMKAQGGLLCSRCPGSELNQARVAESAGNKREAGMDRGEKARAARLQEKEVAYDPNTPVYLDALWFRAHAADCPSLILKEEKKTMTLEEADKAGARLGESGQSGRENCCLVGYRRKYPLKTISDDTVLLGNDSPRNVKHLAGCHRYWPDQTHLRRTRSEWEADGFVVCPHCIERGPSLTSIPESNWNKLPPGGEFAAPEGWMPKPFSPEHLPPASEREILIQETLHRGIAIQELPFADPVASLEQFMTMRFFFPVHQWLNLYMAYRGTGDDRIRNALLASARHYHQVSLDYPAAVQLKASDPEGLPYMYSMAVSARITLQLARTQPNRVSPEELREAEAFLKTMVSVLKPNWESNENLDPEMGIPKPLADDFRSRAFNRAMNGIGTLATIAAALEDLQKVQGVQTYQPTIDRYRKTVQAYVRNWHSEGHFCEFDGQNHFYYPYTAGKSGRADNGCVIFNRPEDAGHYSHTMQGVVLLYETMPEAGIDDAFMTAVANALHHNSTTKIRRDGKMVLSGHLECPHQSAKRPYGSSRDGHQYSPARERFYYLHAFRRDLIDGLCDPLNAEKKVVANSEYDKRLATLFGHYVKALRGNRSLVYLEWGK